MVERIVMIKLDAAHAEERAQVAAESEARLARIPGVHAVVAQLPADDASLRSWDLCLKLRFDDVAAVEAYRPHPIHEAYHAEVLRPRGAFVKAWNFELPAAG